MLCGAGNFGKIWSACGQHEIAYIKSRMNKCTIIIYNDKQQVVNLYVSIFLSQLEEGIQQREPRKAAKCRFPTHCLSLCNYSAVVGMYGDCSHSTLIILK